MRVQPFFYDKQIERYLIQFANIFSGFQVQVGVGNDEHLITVPIMYGSQDKVVSSIYAGNTQNKPIRLPVISTHMTGLEMAADMYKGVGQEDRMSYLPSGGVLPDDVKVIKRYMPVPYIVNADVNIYSSNQTQQLQILEQILVLFDPTFMIQTSDAKFDWTKLTQVELTGINMEETVPQGGEERTIISRLSFSFPVWITPPAKKTDEFVKRIRLRVGAVDGDLSETDIVDFFNGAELKYHTIVDADKLFGNPDEGVLK